MVGRIWLILTPLPVVMVVALLSCTAQSSDVPNTVQPDYQQATAHPKRMVSPTPTSPSRASVALQQPGTYRVGSPPGYAIPGTYHGEVPENSIQCYWVRRDKEGKLIANSSYLGGAIVTLTVLPTDYTVTIIGNCGNLKMLSETPLH